MTDVSQLKKELKRTEKNLKASKANLQEARDAFLNKKGSNESEKAKIVEKQKELEEATEANEDKHKKYAKKLDEVVESYEAKAEDMEELEEGAKRLYGQMKDKEGLIKEVRERVQSSASSLFPSRSNAM